MIDHAHIQVLQTLYFTGAITRQAMKSIRGQVIRMETFEEREAYLKKLIARTQGEGEWWWWEISRI